MPAPTSALLNPPPSPSGACGRTASEAASVIGTYEQLLVLLYDCSLLAESGALNDPGSTEYEHFLGSRDPLCRDVVAAFLSEPPSSGCVHAYMLLLRTVGVALSLKVDYIPLAAMFSRPQLDSFPRLTQVGGGPSHIVIHKEWAGGLRREARLSARVIKTTARTALSAHLSWCHGHALAFALALAPALGLGPDLTLACRLGFGSGPCSLLVSVSVLVLVRVSVSAS